MPECPYPANTGGRVVEWNRVKELGKKNDIYLFVIIDDESECKFKDEVGQYCKEVRFYVRHKTINLLLKSFIIPYPAVSRWNKEMKSDIDRCFADIKPDIVMVEFPQMMGNLSKNIKENAKIVLNQHNIEHLSMLSIAIHCDNRLRREIYKIVSKQLKNYEKREYRKVPVSLYTFVSESDKAYFEKEYGLHNTLLVPIGAKVQDIKSAVHSQSISFIAKMSYEPNETGAIWFVENVWDIVINRFPEAELFLVGKDPSDKLKECCKQHKRITVTGTVDSVEPYYEQSVAVIVPILSGGGVKVKLLEGLGHGKIVVTTNKGIEGTGFIGGRHVLATDSAEKFADLCCSVLDDPEQFDQIRNEANELMKEKYSWAGILSNFENRLRNL